MIQIGIIRKIDMYNEAEFNFLIPLLWFHNVLKIPSDTIRK